MAIGDVIALVNLAFTIVTTLCALFLSYTALKHATRPNISVILVNAPDLRCRQEVVLVFLLVNRGYWYESPHAVDVTVFCNFDRGFHPQEIRYGSVQEYVSHEVRMGDSNMKFLKAKGIKLSREERGEEIHVKIRTPDNPGDYQVRITGYSANGASFSREFSFACGS